MRIVRSPHDPIPMWRCSLSSTSSGARARAGLHTPPPPAHITHTHAPRCRRRPPTHTVFWLAGLHLPACAAAPAFLPVPEKCWEVQFAVRLHVKKKKWRRGTRKGMCQPTEDEPKWISSPQTPCSLRHPRCHYLAKLRQQLPPGLPETPRTIWQLESKCKKGHNS